MSTDAKVLLEDQQQPQSAQQVAPPPYTPGTAAYPPGNTAYPQGPTAYPPGPAPYPPTQYGHNPAPGAPAGPGQPGTAGVYAQPHPQSTAMMMPAPQTTTTMMVVQGFGDYPATTTCPNCRDQVTTRVTHEPGSQAWLFCLLMCFFCLWCFALIPFCVDSMQTAHHDCPNCKYRIGTVNR